MSKFIHLDSQFRDRQVFPNPANFKLTSTNELIGFDFSARTVQSTAGNPRDRQVVFANNVELKSLILPRSATLVIEPIIYVDFHCSKYDDSWPINTIKGKNSDGRFIAEFDKIQFAADGTTPLWIHYKCKMNQVMRFEVGQPLVFRVFDRTGVTIPIVDAIPPLPINSAVQVFCTFCITPYSRDGDFTNHFTDLKLVN